MDYCRCCGTSTQESTRIETCLISLYFIVQNRSSSLNVNTAVLVVSLISPETRSSIWFRTVPHAMWMGLNKPCLWVVWRRELLEVLCSVETIVCHLLFSNHSAGHQIRVPVGPLSTQHTHQAGYYLVASRSYCFCLAVGAALRRVTEMPIMQQGRTGKILQPK